VVSFVIGVVKKAGSTSFAGLKRGVICIVRLEGTLAADLLLKQGRRVSELGIQKCPFGAKAW
jgi:hypothetical protein